MPRRRKPSRHGSAKVRAVPVVVDVPLGVDIPRVVQAKAPERFPPKRKVVIGTKPRKTRKAAVTVLVPRRMPKMRKGYAMYRPGQLVIYGTGRTDKILEREHNRRRREEVKRRRRRYSDGQLHSVRSDRFGIVGAAVERGVDADRLNDVAMVARALERF